MFLRFLVSLLVVHGFEHERRTFQFELKARSGTRLHTRVVLPPKRARAGADQFATIIDRSPYGYQHLEEIADLWLPAGFATVGQDMSGTEKSGGNFTIWKSDADDGQDLGDWIVEQEWSNGVVYSFGGSADGIAAHRLPYNKPSWLHGQAFLVSSALLYETLFPNGAYLQSLVESWMKGTVRDWEFERVLGTVKENEMRTEWWDDREMTGKYETLVKFPATFWAGWYDIFLGPNLLTFNGYNYQSDLSVRGTAKIVVDPLGHCQDAASFFPQNLVQGRSLVGMANMYELFGVPRRDHTRPRLKNVTFYVMSSNDAAGLAIGNYWTSLDQFPEVRPVRFFLRADGSLSTVHLGAKDQEAVNSSFVYDPANPVPTKGGANLDLPCGPLDQKDDAGTPLDERADVLVFETDQVAEKEALWLTGALSATLHVASSAIDTDFTVKLSDVYPSGEVRILQDGNRRMRWREGGTKPVYMQGSGEVYSIQVDLWNISYVIAPGHRLRASISSSNFPRFSVNPNNGLLLSDPMYPGTPVVATNTIFHSTKHPSFLSLPVVQFPREQLPIHRDIGATVAGSYPELANHIKEHPSLGSIPSAFTRKI